MTRKSMQAILICVALVFAFSSQAICGKAQLVEQQADQLKITACWVSPEMDAGSLDGLPDAEMIIAGIRSSYASYYHGIEIGRGVAMLAVWLINTGDSEQILQITEDKALIEKGGRRDDVLITVAVPRADDKESSKKDLGNQIARVPAHATASYFFLCEGPSPEAQSVSFSLGVVPSSGAKVFSSDIVLSEQMRNYLSSYVERARGMACVEKAEFSDAIAHYDTAVSLYPTNPVFLINRAVAHIKNDEPDLGAEDCRKAVSLLVSGNRPNSEYLEKAYINLGTCERRLGNDDAAVEAYGAAVLANEKSALAYLEMADLYLEKKEFADVRQALKKAKSRDPGNARLLQMGKELDRECMPRAEDLLRQAQEHLDSGVTEDAIRACQSAIELMPDDQNILYGASDVFRSAGYNDFAIAELRKLVTQYADMPLYHVDLAIAYKAKGMNDAAKAEATSARKLNKSVPSVAFTIALRYVTLGCAEFGVLELQSVLKYLPKSGELYAELGMAYEESGQDQQAKAAYMRAISLNPKSAFIRFNYGVYLHRKKSFASAIEQYNLARRYRASKPTTMDFGHGTKFPIPQPSSAQLNEMVLKAKAHQSDI